MHTSKYRALYAWGLLRENIFGAGTGLEGGDRQGWVSARHEERTARRIVGKRGDRLSMHGRDRLERKSGRGVCVARRLTMEMGITKRS